MCITLFDSLLRRCRFLYSDNGIPSFKAWAFRFNVEFQ